MHTTFLHDNFFIPKYCNTQWWLTSALGKCPMTEVLHPSDRKTCNTSWNLELKGKYILVPKKSLYNHRIFKFMDNMFNAKKKSTAFFFFQQSFNLTFHELLEVSAYLLGVKGGARAWNRVLPWQALPWTPWMTGAFFPPPLLGFISWGLKLTLSLYPPSKYLKP